MTARNKTCCVIKSLPGKALDALDMALQTLLLGKYAPFHCRLITKTSISYKTYDNRSLPVIQNEKGGRNIAEVILSTLRQIGIENVVLLKAIG